MRAGNGAAFTVVCMLLLPPTYAGAQHPVRSFDQLDTRLKPGDSVWVTDAQGREVKGKVTALAPDALTIDAAGARTFSAADVRLVVERRPDSLANGALIGFGVGAVALGAACLASTSGQDRDWCLIGAVFYGGVGAAAGVAIDALMPGRKLDVYRAPPAGERVPQRISIAPIFTPRAKGVALSFSF